MSRERRYVLKAIRERSSRLNPVKDYESDISDNELWKNYSVRTDLALEAQEVVSQRIGQEVPGVTSEQEQTQYATITRVQVLTPEAERTLGKPRGIYITIESQHIRAGSKEINEGLAQVFAKEFLRLAPLSQNATVLIVGLGIGKLHLMP